MSEQLPEWLKSQINAKCKECFNTPEYGAWGGALCHLCTNNIKLGDNKK